MRVPQHKARRLLTEVYAQLDEATEEEIVFTTDLLEAELREEKKGLWANIHAKRKRGESPAKPGDKDYPKTLDIDEADEMEECGISMGEGIVYFVESDSYVDTRTNRPNKVKLFR